MAVIFDAINDKGKYSQIAIKGSIEKGQDNIVIIEDNNDIIKTDDYRVLEKYTKFNNSESAIKEVSEHISYLYDYIEFISQRLQISKYADLPEFKRYRTFAIGSRGKEQYYKLHLDNAYISLSEQRRIIETNIFYKSRFVKFVKWALAIIATAMVLICVCFVVNISVSKQSYSRYIKSGSTVIDTKNNSILRRTNDGWEWQPMKK